MQAIRPVMALPSRPLPRMAHVRQNLPADRIADARNDVRSKLEGSGSLRNLRAGSRVAITAGSRGIGGFLDLLAGIVDAVRAMGGEPFIIPAMGSHGGATPEGQTEILSRLGVNDQTVNAPIRATMQTHDVGTAPNGAVAQVDRLAAEADGIIVLARTSIHPESAEDLASGLLKMCTIGLGKQTGALQAHTHGLWDSVREVPHWQIARAPILCGVAVVENGFREACVVEVVAPSYEAFLAADMRLLKTAKEHLAHIPFEHLDLLVVDEIGKTVSGSGIDPNVIGQPPIARRIAALSLTHGSLGNGLGIGFADFTTQRFLDAYDPLVSYINLLTATEPGGNTREGPVPLALGSDREALEVALFSSVAGAHPRVCRIQNTGLLAELWISEAMVPEATQRSLTFLSDPAPLAYDPHGNLL